MRESNYQQSVLVINLVSQGGGTALLDQGVGLPWRALEATLGSLDFKG